MANKATKFYSTEDGEGLYNEVMLGKLIKTFEDNDNQSETPVYTIINSPALSQTIK